MSYERLELIDGVTKWDAEKVQHLENAIIKNEEDIQKYHNDTIVEMQMQADWNQENAAAKDYVKNRTHYSYKDYGQVIYYRYMRFNGEWEEWYEDTNLLPYEQIIESDLTPEEAPGYWLGSMGGYYASGRSGSAIVDAYSHWSIINTNGDTTTYHCDADGVGFFDVSVQTMTSNKYRVTLTSAHSHSDGEQVIGLLGVEYKPLDEVYIPDTIARAPKTIFNDIEDAPTASDFNTLLSILREAGILATE